MLCFKTFCYLDYVFNKKKYVLSSMHFSSIIILNQYFLTLQTDKNRDALISLEEFLKMTEQQEFQKDEGWKVSLQFLVF